jgi:hypothetical protein
MARKTPGAEVLKLDCNSNYDTTEKQKGHYPAPRDLSTLFSQALDRLQRRDPLPPVGQQSRRMSNFAQPSPWQ